MRKATLTIVLVMLFSAVATSKPNTTRADRNKHNQKYTLKKRKKAGGTYNTRKTEAKRCFWLLGVKFCNQI